MKPISVLFRPTGSAFRASLPILALFLGAHFARAQVNSWTNTGSAGWQFASNWVLNAAPASTHSIFITNAGTKVVTVDALTASVTNRMTVSNLTVSGVAGATNTLFLNNAGLNPTNTLRVLDGLAVDARGILTNIGSALEVRGQGGNGFQVEGLVVMNSGLLIATNTGTTVGEVGNGSFQLNGGSAQLSYLSLGDQGGSQGTFTQTGGSNSLSGGLMVAPGIASGVYNLSNGFFFAVGMDVGFGGVGMFNQSGGSVVATNGIYLGDGPGSSGSYNLANGSLTTAGLLLGFSGTGVVSQTGGSLVGSSITVGMYGRGTVNQSGGTATITNAVSIGQTLSSSGTYNLSSNAVLNGSYLSVGYEGVGVFNQNGAVHTVTTLNIAESLGSVGSYNFTNGVLNASDVMVGANGGAGVFNQNGGTNTLTDQLSLGVAAGSSGTFNLINSVLNNSYADVGANGGAGVFNQTGGTHVLTNDIWLADGPGSKGTYNLTNGSLTSVNAYVGHSGTGVLNQVGGTNTAFSLSLGAFVGGNGTYTLGNGSLLASYASVGGEGLGVFTQNGGLVAVSNEFHLSDTSGSGTYNLNSGLLLPPSEFWVGNFGPGVINQSGGTNSVPAEMHLGEKPGGSGSYNLTNGMLNVGSRLLVGNAGNGVFNQAGGTVSITSNLIVASSAGSSSSYALRGGSLTPASVIVNPGGAFVETSGLLSSSLTNSGIFSYDGGGFTGRLVNYGAINVTNNFLIGNGMANFAMAPLTGVRLTLNGAGLDNEGTLTLAGAALAGSGGLTNNSYLAGNGGIGGSARFINNGSMQVTGSSLTLSNSGANINAGNIDLASGAQLQLSGANLANNGSLNLGSGLVLGSSSLVNNVGGIVSGRGTIGTTLVNSGTVAIAESGTLTITRGWTNNGSLSLDHVAANLAGGVVTNLATIRGFGNIASAVVNRGTIEASGGALNLNGSVSNLAGALMTSPSGSALFVSSGLALNSGVIAISGGTFDNNNHLLQNNGQIGGYGALRSSGLLNAGSVTLSGGLSLVNGNLTNQAAHLVTVADDPAIFTGTVVNNGAWKAVNTTVQFSGTYIENGSYNSDPADTFFSDLIIGTSGFLIGHGGDLFSVAGNFSNGSFQSAQWDTATAELDFRGGSSHSFSLAGLDAGTNFAGFTTNFAWQTLRLAAGESLVLSDGNGNSGAALYVRSLILEGGLPQIAGIAGNGFKIYYDPTAAGSSYLASKAYSLTGGGAIIPVTQSPLLITAIKRLSNSFIHLDCSGSPNTSHTIMASSNLFNWVVIGNQAAPATGIFSFDDTNAPASPKRFYRLSLP